MLQLLARLLLSTVFLASGITHVTDLSGAVAYAQMNGFPLQGAAATAAVGAAAALLVVGSLLIVTNLAAKAGYQALLIFLVPVTYFMHIVPLQTAEDEASKMGHMVNTMKNMSLAGALLLLLLKDGEGAQKKQKKN